MKFVKQFSVSLLAFVAATSAFAANQPITATTASIKVDATAITSGLPGFAAAAVGGATFTSDGVNAILTAPVQNVTTSANPGPALIELTDAAGLKFTKLLTPSITLSNLSFNTANNELYGNLMVGTAVAPLLNIVNQSVLTAGSVSSSLGTEVGPNFTSSDSARSLGLLASGFSLSQSFKDYMMNTYELDASQFGYVADMIKEVKIGTVYVPPVTPVVPEPSTYALMGVGLACVGFIARRRKQA